jgi:hypothetical protein
MSHQTLRALIEKKIGEWRDTARVEREATDGQYERERDLLNTSADTLDICADDIEALLLSVGQEAPPPTEKKPFRLNVTREWCEKMAALEDGGDVSAGGNRSLQQETQMILNSTADNAQIDALMADLAQRIVEHVDCTPKGDDPNHDDRVDMVKSVLVFSLNGWGFVQVLPVKPGKEQ